MIGQSWFGVSDMDTSYDIFMRLTDAGPPLWIETVASLEEAKQRVAVLSSRKCGTYLVFDWRLGTFIEPLETFPSKPLSTTSGRLSLVHN